MYTSTYLRIRDWYDTIATDESTSRSTREQANIYISDMFDTLGLSGFDLFADAGDRKLFIVSVPVANTHKDAATAAPEPPEDPPGVLV